MIESAFPGILCRLLGHQFKGRRNIADGAMCFRCGLIDPFIEWPEHIYKTQRPESQDPDMAFHPLCPPGVYKVTYLDNRGERRSIFAYFNPRTQHWLKDGSSIGFADRINAPDGQINLRVVSMVNYRLRPTGSNPVKQ